MIIDVGADYIAMSQDNYTFYAKDLGSAKSFVIYTSGFAQHCMIRLAVYLYGFTVFM